MTKYIKSRSSRVFSHEIEIDFRVRSQRFRGILTGHILIDFDTHCEILQLWVHYHNQGSELRLLHDFLRVVHEQLQRFLIDFRGGIEKTNDRISVEDALVESNHFGVVVFVNTGFVIKSFVGYAEAVVYFHHAAVAYTQESAYHKLMIHLSSHIMIDYCSDHHRVHFAFDWC